MHPDIQDPPRSTTAATLSVRCQGERLASESWHSNCSSQYGKKQGRWDNLNLIKGNGESPRITLTKKGSLKVVLAFRQAGNRALKTLNTRSGFRYDPKSTTSVGYYDRIVCFATCWVSICPNLLLLREQIYKSPLSGR